MDELENLQISERLKLIVDSYQQAYSVPPNCIIAPDQTINYFLDKNYLRNHNKEKGAYSGTRLETGIPAIIKVYWLGRFKPDELIYLAQPQEIKKLKLHKAGGILPLIFAIETNWFKRLTEGINRFSNPLFCDLGVPFEQFQQKIASQLPKKTQTQ